MKKYIKMAGIGVLMLLSACGNPGEKAERIEEYGEAVAMENVRKVSTTDGVVRIVWLDFDTEI
jgi:hypothetical protein